MTQIELGAQGTGLGPKGRGNGEVHHVAAHTTKDTSTPRMVPPVVLVGYVIVATALFAGLAYLARTNPTLPGDLGFTLALQQFRNPLMDSIASGLEWTGLPPQSNYIFGTLIIAVFLIGWRWGSLMALAAAIGSVSLYFIFEPIIDRSRPSADLINVIGSLPRGGFPSGHAAISLAIYGAFLYLALTKLSAGVLRTVAAVLLGGVILAAGLSRVYLGQHWISDVLGGWLMGSAWLALMILLYQGGLVLWQRWFPPKA